MTDVDDFLAHYGVKGMKWGVTKDKSRAAGLSRIKEIESIKSASGHRIWDGALMRAHYSGKEAKRRARKDPGFDTRKLSREDRDAFERKVTRRATASIAISAVGEAAAAVALGKVGGKYLFGLNSNNSTKSGIAFAALVLSARGNQIYNVRAASNSLARFNEISDIRKDLGMNKLTAAQKEQRAQSRAKNKARKEAKAAKLAAAG